MPLDPQKLLHWPFDELIHTYSQKDTILYALGLGIGSAPTDPNELRYVYESELRTLPSMAVVLAYPGFWISDPNSGVDWTRYLHGEQSIEIHSQLPASGTVRGLTKVTDVIDKGVDKGALILTERRIFCDDSNELLATVRSTGIARSGGGFSDTSPGTLPLHIIPDRNSDLALNVTISTRAALLYRLSGDYNPLHADPRIAKKAGFSKPILHGLCTFGISCYQIIRHCFDNCPATLVSMSTRFSAPVYPGDTLTIEIWRDSELLSFRATVKERDAVVLNNGRVTFTNTQEKPAE